MINTVQNQEQKKPHPWRRRIAIVSVIVLAIALCIALFGQAVVQRIVREKLQTLVTGELNAQLSMGTLGYNFPYGVSVRDVALTTVGPDGAEVNLATFDRLGLVLGRFPLRPGPLVIERIDIQKPTVHVIRTADGFVGEKGMIRPRNSQSPANENRVKLSDVLTLRHVSLVDARVQYEDRTVPNTQPLVWENLDVIFNAQSSGSTSTTQPSGSHAWTFTAVSGDVAQIDGEGIFSIDELVFDISRLTIATYVAAGAKESPLPQQVQAVLTQFGIAGDAKVTVAARVPLLDIDNVTGSVELRVDNARGQVPGLPEPLDDLDLVASASYAPGKVTARVGFFAGRSASTGVALQPVEINIDTQSGEWTASPVKLAVAYVPMVSKVDSLPLVFSQQMTASITGQLTQEQEPRRVQFKFDGTTVSLQGIATDAKLDGAIAFSDAEVTLSPTVIDGLGGPIKVTGVYNFRTDALRAEVETRDVQLAMLNAIMNPFVEKEVKGVLTSQVIVRYVGDPLGATGSGRFVVRDGRFAKVPVLAQIAQTLGFAEGLFVANNAAGRFTISDQKVKLERVGVSTLALRIRGSGEIGFDKSLDLTVYADSATNWGKNVKQTNVPIISEVGGAIAGGTQAVIGGISKQFTQMRVRGTTDAPTITPEPMSVITDPIKKLFQREDKELLDE